MTSVLSTLLIALVIGFAVSLLANVCTTVYLHRALSHRAVTLAPSVEWVFRFLLWITTGIQARQWVAVHRKHHAFTGKEGDPHPAELVGWVRVQVMNVAMYRKEAQNEVTVARYARDIPEDKWDRRLFDHTLLGLAIGIGILVVVFGPVVGLLAAFFHANLYLGGSAAVNAIGHHFGRRPYENTAGNLHWLAFMTAGEGYHNNHHAVPTSPRLSHHWYQFDLGWLVIRGLSALGLAKLREPALARIQTAPRRAA
jgi:stearoyl-CoA desaturase (Delta-9 desaturase)